MISKYKHIDVEQFAAKQITVVRFTDSELVDRNTTTQMQQEIESYIAQQRPAQLVLSFDSVARCSSEIVNSALRVRKQLLADDGEVKLCGMSDEIHDIFRALNLENTVFEIHRTETDAMQAF